MMPDSDETLAYDDTLARVIEINCPNCMGRIHLPEDSSALDVTCPKCSKHIVLPSSTKSGKLDSDRAKQVLKDVFEAGDSGLTVAAFLDQANKKNDKATDKTTPYRPKKQNQTKGFLQSETTQRYEVMNIVASGGMGAVLASRDLNIRRNVAMKVMLRRGKVSNDELIRFIEEAQITGQLEHPNIIPVYELGLDAENNVFYTMKYAKGLTLQQILEKLHECDAETVTKFPLNVLINIFQKLCDATAYAHSRGIIHRDLKPANIIVGDFGEVLVLDWGLARSLKRVHSTKGVKDRVSTVDSIRHETEVMNTINGTVLGTPAFMSPEQARGDIDDLDERSDIYALGGILYMILTLHRPIEANSAKVLFSMLLNGVITPPDHWNPGKALSATYKTGLPHCPGNRIPDSLSAVAMKALELDPANRYPNVTNLQQDVEAWQSGYATLAESASLSRQILLLIKRNRTTFTMTALSVLLFLITGGILSYNLKSSRDAQHVQLTRSEALFNQVNDVRQQMVHQKRKVTLQREIALRQKRDLEREKNAVDIKLYCSALNHATISLTLPKPDPGHIRTILNDCPTRLQNCEWHFLNARVENLDLIKRFKPSERTSLYTASGNLLPFDSANGLFLPAQTLPGGTVVSSMLPQQLFQSHDVTTFLWLKKDAIEMLDATGTTLTKLPRPPYKLDDNSQLSLMRSGTRILISPVMNDATPGTAILTINTKKWIFKKGILETPNLSHWHNKADQVVIDGTLIPFDDAPQDRSPDRWQYFISDLVIQMEHGRFYKVYNAHTPGPILLEVSSTTTFPTIIGHIAYSPIRNMGIFQTGPSKALFFDIHTGVQIGGIETENGQILAMDCSTDGKRLITYLSTGQLEFWDIETRVKLLTYALPKNKRPPAATSCTLGNNHIRIITSARTYTILKLK